MFVGKRKKGNRESYHGKEISKITVNQNFPIKRAPKKEAP
jgi:hypothetical protein